jgi:hypothetical protein
MRIKDQRKSIIPFADCRRIFRVIYTVLEGVNAKTSSSCIFFAVTGATLLRHFYKLKAIPVAGAAAYSVGSRTVGDEGIVSTFGIVEDGKLIATPEAFHCWIECEGFAIDFMAPIFQENLHTMGITDAIVPRRIFQKPLSVMSPTLPQEFREGDFHLVPSRERCEAMQKSFMEKPGHSDLSNVCACWYKRPPAHMDEQFAMGSDQGETIMKLQGPDVIGFW